MTPLRKGICTAKCAENAEVFYRLHTLPHPRPLIIPEGGSLWERGDVKQEKCQFQQKQFVSRRSPLSLWERVRVRVGSYVAKL